MRTRRVWHKRIFVLIIIIIALSSAQRFVMFKPGSLEVATSYVLYPLLIVQQKVISPVQRWFARRLSVHELINIAEITHQQKESLQAENIALKSILDHYNSVAELQEFKQRYSPDYGVTAQVILKNFGDTEHFFLLDAGSNRHIKPDMVVIYKNCLVGRIKEVFPYYSKAVLITDQSCKIAAQCTTTSARGIHQGNNKTDATRLLYISHLEKLQKGDLVISSGEGLVFPKGFGLGTIASWEKEGFQYSVVMQPLIDLHAINACIIIQKGAEFKQE